jgi:hypothetical protein
MCNAKPFLQPPEESQWPSPRLLEAELYLRLGKSKFQSADAIEEEKKLLEKACQYRKFTAIVQTKSLKGGRRNSIIIVDRRFDEFSISFFRDLITGERYLYIDDVRIKKTGGGGLKQVFPELMELAKYLGCGSIRLSACFYGKYAWLRYGFLPDAQSWAVVVPSIQKQARILLRGKPKLLDKVEGICANPDPNRFCRSPVWQGAS